MVSNLLAPPAVRDRVYRKLIEISPASFNREIVNGQGGLRDRGINDYSQYGSLPKSVSKRNILAERLFEELGKEPIGEIFSCGGIPGFWRDTNGRLRHWNTFDSKDELMLIPFVGHDGLVQACQIRFMRYVRDKPGHYVMAFLVKRTTGLRSRIAAASCGSWFILRNLFWLRKEH